MAPGKAKRQKDTRGYKAAADRVGRNDYDRWIVFEPKNKDYCFWSSTIGFRENDEKNEDALKRQKFYFPQKKLLLEYRQDTYKVTNSRGIPVEIRFFLRVDKG